MTKFEKFQRLLLILLIGIGCFFLGHYFGKRGYLFEVRKNPPKIEIINRYPNESTLDFSLFWQVWDLIEQNYLERPVDAQKMIYGAISGMVSSLGDPYTSFLPPEINETISNALNGTYQGIGAELGMRENQLIVVAPLEGSPAKYVGLKAGDKILEIEGESTIGITLTEAVAKIRGEAGTVSTLTIQTGNNEPRELKITRGVISVPSVEWEDKGEGIAYIKVTRFGDETNEDWKKTVSEIDEKIPELDAVVLDLRGNPGGYLQSSIYLAEEFFKDKVVLYQESALGELQEFKSKRAGVFKDVPAVYVLIDGGSASASEILAAALKKNVSATLIGTKSFGKGTIQEAKDFEDGSGIHITVSKWLTPEKVWVHEKGIEPDIIIERSDDEIDNEIDSQLDKAIELAKEI